MLSCLSVSQVNKSHNAFFLFVTKNTHLFAREFILLHRVGASLFGTVVLREGRREEAQLAPFVHFSCHRIQRPNFLQSFFVNTAVESEKDVDFSAY